MLLHDVPGSVNDERCGQTINAAVGINNFPGDFSAGRESGSMNDGSGGRVGCRRRTRAEVAGEGNTPDDADRQASKFQSCLKPPHSGHYGRFMLVLRVSIGEMDAS